MGRSEWTFPVASKNDVNDVLALVKLHNTCDNEDLIGEQLEIYCLFYRIKTKTYYLCVSNGGGRDSTGEFIMRHYDRKKINKVLFPFNKPKWYSDSKAFTDYWFAESYEEMMKPEEFIKTPWD
jgi:hypothetical protein